MFRVLHLIKALGRGGAEVLLKEGLGVANRDRFDYTYGYLQSRPDAVAYDLRAQGAEVVCFNLDSNIRKILEFRRVASFLRERDIDIIHAHLPLGGIVARLAGRLAGVPVVYTEHNVFDSYHPLVRGLGRATWPLQDTVLAISPDVEESIHRMVGKGVPVQTVLNGVNIRIFSPWHGGQVDARSLLGLPAEVPIVGTVAVFGPQKRLDVWLGAARRILDQEPMAHFLMVGDGRLRPELERQAEALGLKGVIHFVGAQRDVKPYLAAMDVFMMSSAFEGFGLAPVEAMAMEIPVVATNVQGVRLVIDSGVTGLLAEFDDYVEQSLADLAVSLIQQPNLRRRLASAGRKSAVEKFSIGRMQRELEGIYERTIEAHRSRYGRAANGAHQS